MYYTCDLNMLVHSLVIKSRLSRMRKFVILHTHTLFDPAFPCSSLPPGSPPSPNISVGSGVLRPSFIPLGIELRQRRAHCRAGQNWEMGECFYTCYRIENSNVLITTVARWYYNRYILCMHILWLYKHPVVICRELHVSYIRWRLPQKGRRR